MSQRLDALRQQRLTATAASDLPKGLIGVNLGKNKISEDAAADYSVGVSKLAQYADYLVINISSPNTPGTVSALLDRPSCVGHGMQMATLVFVTCDYTANECGDM